MNKLGLRISDILWHLIPRRVTEMTMRMISFVLLNLSDKGLDVERLKLKLDIRNHDVLTQFTREVGVPPYAFIETVRIFFATLLLRKTNVRVKEVADCVGYNSISAFNRGFKRLVGCSPTEYRKKDR